LRPSVPISSGRAAAIAVPAVPASMPSFWLICCSGAPCNCENKPSVIELMAMHPVETDPDVGRARLFAR
jgi:hypothetical protein